MRKLNNFISNALQQEAEKRNKVDRHLQYYLPEELTEHMKVISLENAQLKISVDSNAWATKIRYLQKEIIKSFQSDPEFYVQTLVIKVARWKEERKERDLPVLSNTAKQQISSSLRGLTDPELKSAFEKLIK